LERSYRITESLYEISKAINISFLVRNKLENDFFLNNMVVSVVLFVSML